MRKILLVGLLVSLGCSWYSMQDSEEVISVKPSVPEAVEPVEQELFVYVTGAVHKPGLYAFKKVVRVADVIHEAGEPVPYADMSLVNYAEPIHDGLHIHIPYNLDGVPASGAENGLININEADEKKLGELPGVGPATAKAIIEQRTIQGPFSAIEDIKKIKGIGEAKFNKLKDKICV